MEWSSDEDANDSQSVDPRDLKERNHLVQPNASFDKLITFEPKSAGNRA